MQSAELAIRPKGFDALSPAEIGMLSAVFRSARHSCRRVMFANWDVLKPTHEYMGLVMELQAIDPLFGLERGLRMAENEEEEEITPAMQFARDLIAQIGRPLMAAISGLRLWVVDDDTALLPVTVNRPGDNGYVVMVKIDRGKDLYIVRRVLINDGRHTVEGYRDEVYCDQVGEAAYFASCYISHSAAEWPHATI